jgi:hypothetical protein
VSQSGYLVVAFAIVAGVIVAWLLIILAKVARIRRDAAALDDDGGARADG